MKNSEFPHLRTHRRVGKDGVVTIYYFWDGRSRGVPDVPLGKDRELAIERWRKCEQGIFQRRAQAAKLKARREGVRRKISAELWSDSEAWVKVMYFNADRRAASSSKAFTLTPEQIKAVVARAGGRCEVSGLQFGDGPFSPSLDRIESSCGYEFSNVRLVCHIANVAMNTWGLEPLLRLSEALLRNASR